MQRTGALAGGRTARAAGLALAVAAFIFSDSNLLPLVERGYLSYGPSLVMAVAAMRAALFAAGSAIACRRRLGGGRLARLLLQAPGAYLLYEALALAVPRVGGALTIALGGAAAVAACFAVRGLLRLAGAALGRRWDLPVLANLALALGSVTAVLVLLEVVLPALPVPPAGGGRGARRIAMPQELRRREIEVPGASQAFFWQGKLHVVNADGLRRTGPFPERSPGGFRILAFGDSLTYGYGVDAADAWPAVLERILPPRLHAEVLNLGQSGAQSEDILRLMRTEVPHLLPDLVLYGVCLNDFLPSFRGEYANNRAWQVPFPDKQHFVETTAVGDLAARLWDALLMKAGVRADFFTDILRNFAGYQDRFRRDVQAMNDFVTASGLPPVVALVLTQSPTTRGQAFDIVRVAEGLLRAADMELAPSDYIRENDGRDLAVGPWEGHPNEEAHRLFAEAFREAIVREFAP